MIAPRQTATDRALATKRLEHVARAIWASQFDEDIAPPGTIEYALAMQMAVAATEALAQAMEMTS